MAVVIMVMGVVSPVRSATRTSTTTGGTWATGSTWIGGSVPAVGDLVIIATTGTNSVSLGGNTTCAGVTVNSGSILKPNNRTLTVNGAVNNQGTITITTGGITQASTLDFTNNGIITLTSGRITLNGNSNIINSGNISYSAAGRLYLRGNLTNTGTLAFGTAAIYFTGTNATASTVDGFTAGGTIWYQRTAGSTTFTGNINGAALTIDAAGGTLNLGTTLSHTFTGVVTLTAGTLNGGSSNLNANRIGGTAWTRATACTFTPAFGTVTLGGLGTQSIAGTGPTTFNNLTISGSGTKTISTVPTVNGVLSMEGLATVTVSKAITLGTASTLQYKGSQSRNTGLEFRTPYTSSNGVIIDQGIGNTVTLMATKSIVNGNLNIKSGTFNTSTYTVNRSALGGSLTIAPGATLQIGGTGTLPSNYATHSIDASSTVYYNGTNQTIAQINSSQNYGHLILSTSGTKTLPNSEIGIVGNLTISGSATVNPGTGTVNLKGANQIVSGTVLFNNLTIATSGLKTLSTSQTVNGILSMEGTATVSAAPTFGIASTIQYLGTGRTIGAEFPAGFAGTGGVIINPGNGNTITLNANKTGLLGNLNIQSGTLDLMSFTMNRASTGGTLTLAAGTNLRIGGTNSLPSNFSSHNFDMNSTVLFNGSGAQSIGGSSSTVFGNLTLDNASSVTLDFNQTVNGVLTLSNGLLNTGSNTLTVGCSGSIANASAARYVNGKLALVFCSTGSRTFPIGKGGNYRPLTLNYSALTGTSTVIAEQIESVLPGAIPSDIDLYGARYWKLSQTGGSGYSYTLTLDGTGWNPTSYLKMVKGDGSTNAHNAVTAPNFTNTNAFTSFGNFGLGQLNCVTWLGTTNDWFTGSNWTSETPPTSTDDIRIPSSVSFHPIISGTSPANDFTLASGGKLQILAGDSLTLDSGPLLTFQSGATVTTGSGSKIVLNSGARYLNLSTSTPTLKVQRQLTGTKGWRMLASPVATTFSDMFKAPLVTQGFTGSSFPSLQPSTLSWLESDGGTSLQSWRKPSDLTDPMESGSGYFHYVFNGAGRLDLNGDPTVFNYGDALPITISATGVEHFNGTGSYNFNMTYTTKASTQTPAPTDTIYYDLNALDEGWNLLGNPTASTLDWDASSGWTKTNVDNTIYVWDPSALSGNGDYLTWNGTTGTLSNGRIAPFQAFWAHATAATTLSFTNAVKSSSAGTFLRSTHIDETVTLPITLSMDDLQTTSFLSFSDKGATGPDRWDAYRLESMSENWLELFTLSSPGFVSPLVINHLPTLNDEMMTIPLYYDAQLKNKASNQQFTLGWSLPNNWPSDWNISLLNHQTEEALSMKEQSTYSFHTNLKGEIVETAGNLPFPKSLLKEFKPASKLRSSSSAQPFSIVIYKGSNIEYMAPKPHLVGSTSNPIRSTTQVRFSLPEKARSQVDVFTSQGQRVATLADDDFPAGITEIPWNATTLAPGLYFIRFLSGKTMETKKVVLMN